MGLKTGSMFKNYEFTPHVTVLSIHISSNSRKKEKKKKKKKTSIVEKEKREK